MNMFLTTTSALELKCTHARAHTQDPELDVEAQFSRHVVRRQKKVIANKMRLQCVSGWLWCK